MKSHNSELTPKNIDVFNYIHRIQQTETRTPTRREIAAHFAIASLANVQHHIEILIRAGWIERCGKSHLKLHHGLPRNFIWDEDLTTRSTRSTSKTIGIDTIKPEKLQTALGKRIRQLRRHYRLTQEKLASIAGIHSTTVWLLENERTTTASLFTIASLAKAFGMTLSQFLDEVEIE